MSDMRQMTERGRNIENSSFSIVDAEVGSHSFDAEQWEIARRVIHATADFEFKDLLQMSPDAVPAGVGALRRGCPVIVDVNMIAAGLSAERLATYGCRTHCFIADEDVVARAKSENSTRAIVSMRKAQQEGLLDGAIVAIGNAPTALLELGRLVRCGACCPALAVGVPVGFVSAAESKDDCATLPCPWIVTRGRKGGSPIAVAILHALLLLSSRGSAAGQAR